jgi:predicted DNA-binding transcriptional regulator AlpA
MVTQNPLPQTGFFRLPQIIGTKGNPPLIPVSRTTWLNGVKSGKYPKPVKLGARTNGWRVSDIYALIDEMGAI